ncbi:hypothetical protein Tco_1065560 [Tanacetum coccineum]
MGTVRCGNDHFAAITRYGDYVQGNLTICHVYNVEGLEHNLFLVGQFCDGNLEVAFHSNTCYVRNLEGDDLFTGSCDSNLYTISISEMAASSPMHRDPSPDICYFCYFVHMPPSHWSAATPIISRQSHLVPGSQSLAVSTTATWLDIIGQPPQACQST